MHTMLWHQHQSELVDVDCENCDSSVRAGARARGHAAKHVELMQM